MTKYISRVEIPASICFDVAVEVADNLNIRSVEGSARSAARDAVRKLQMDNDEGWSSLPRELLTGRCYVAQRGLRVEVVDVEEVKS